MTKQAEEDRGDKARAAESPPPQEPEKPGSQSHCSCYQTPTALTLQFIIPQTFYPVIDYSALKLHFL